MRGFYGVGLAGVLPDRRDQRPGGLYRDELLFSVVDAVAGRLLLDDYELREVLDADLPMACGSDDDVGDLVVMARSDNVGGALSPERAKPMIDALASLGTTGELAEPIAAVIPFARVILLPPPALNVEADYEPTHPLHGVAHMSLVDALGLLEPLEIVDEVARARRLFAYCRDQRFPVSFWRA